MMGSSHGYEAIFRKEKSMSAEVKQEGTKIVIDKGQEKVVKGKTFRVFHQRAEMGLPMSLVKTPDWGGLMWYWLPLLAYAMAIVYVSSLSAPKQELVMIVNAVNALIPTKGDIFPMLNDKMFHMTEYAVLAVLTYRAFRYSMKDMSEITIGLLTVGAVILFGCTDELHQWFTPLRFTDSWDLMADALGGIIGVSLWHCALSIPLIRFLEERIPLQLQLALGIHALKL